MHDPLTCVCRIVLPIPRLGDQTQAGTGRWGIRRLRGSDPTHWGSSTLPWWLPKGWLVSLGGRRLRWRHVATIWHREPSDRDAGSVCGRIPHGVSRVAWGIQHFRHLSLEVFCLVAAHRWLFQRCAHCGGKSRRGAPVSISHSWFSRSSGLFKSHPGLYHETCSSLVFAIRQRDDALHALRAAGVTVEQLAASGVESTVAWRVLRDAARAGDYESTVWSQR